MQYTPSEYDKIKEDKKKVRSKKIKEPQKRYVHYIPEIRATILSNEKDKKKVKKKYGV